MSARFISIQIDSFWDFSLRLPFSNVATYLLSKIVSFSSMNLMRFSRSTLNLGQLLAICENLLMCHLGRFLYLISGHFHFFTKIDWQRLSVLENENRKMCLTFQSKPNMPIFKRLLNWIKNIFCNLTKSLTFICYLDNYVHASFIVKLEQKLLLTQILNL